MSEKTFRLEIVAPERVVYSDDVYMVIARATNGDIGILPGHAPLITGLQIGVVRIKKEGTEERVAVAGGFMEVKPDKVVIVANAAERAEEIDVSRAQAAKERAEKRLAEKSDEIDVVRAEAALKRAMARLKATGKE